jgi:uracil-DNA glycosylase
MAALHANGLANQPISRGIDDGLELRHAWIAAAVRCAPPDNLPTPEEIAACRPHLAAELAALPNLRVYVALGRIAYDACWRILADPSVPRFRRPPFGHGARYRTPDGRVIIAAYHPSRQNTNTGRLTQGMLRQVFRVAAKAGGVRKKGKGQRAKGKGEGKGEREQVRTTRIMSKPIADRADSAHSHGKLLA